MNEKVFQKEEWLYEEVVVTQLKAEDQDLDPVELYDCTIINAKLTGSTLKRWVFENCIFKEYIPSADEIEFKSDHFLRSVDMKEKVRNTYI